MMNVLSCIENTLKVNYQWIFKVQNEYWPLNTSTLIWWGSWQQESLWVRQVYSWFCLDFHCINYAIKSLNDELLTVNHYKNTAALHIYILKIHQTVFTKLSENSLDIRSSGKASCICIHIQHTVKGISKHRYYLHIFSYIHWKLCTTGYVWRLTLLCLWSYSL
jgi:hypothetical protein